MPNHLRCPYAAVFGSGSSGKIPYFLLCEALLNLEDGWASFRVMATCRLARDEAELVAKKLRAARRALLEMITYLQAEHPFLPGFDPVDCLDMGMQRLTIWDPPRHVTICMRPPAFMEDAFAHGSEENMRAWIQEHGVHGTPLMVLRAMNFTQLQCTRFQAFLDILEEGNARFLYSPFGFGNEASHGTDHEANPAPGPGLVIIVRYHGFPIAICARYTTMNYINRVFAPWFHVVAAVSNVMP